MWRFPYDLDRTIGNETSGPFRVPGELKLPCGTTKEDHLHACMIRNKTPAEAFTPPADEK